MVLQILWMSWRRVLSYAMIMNVIPKLTCLIWLQLAMKNLKQIDLLGLMFLLVIGAGCEQVLTF